MKQKDTTDTEMKDTSDARKKDTSDPKNKNRSDWGTRNPLRRGSLESFSFAGRNQFLEIRDAEVGNAGLALSIGSNGISLMSCKVSCIDSPEENLSRYANRCEMN